MDYQQTNTIDSQTMRHYSNDNLVVLHCHHYLSLFTQLADDAKYLDGPKILANTSKKIFKDVLSKYFKENNIIKLEDKIALSQDYFSKVGLGKMEIKYDDNIVILTKSHVDEGWIKKWNTSEKSINYFGAGYICAVFSIIREKDINIDNVFEIKSIAMGNDISEFLIKE